MLVVWYLVLFVAFVEPDGNRTVRAQTIEVFHTAHGRTACAMKKAYLEREMKKAYPDDVDYYFACLEKKTFPVRDPREAS